MDNMNLYNQVRKAPPEALKRIEAGRLRGFSDINPVWRIQALTEQFGPCGFGWRLEVVRFWLEPGAKDEIAAFCQANLYIKLNNEWSEPIPGIGGSMFVASERNGLHVSDECYKMAFTDAVSVACKQLGFAADVYWEAGGDSKYGQRTAQQKTPPPSEPMTAEKWAAFWDKAGADGWTREEVEELAGEPIDGYDAEQVKLLRRRMNGKRMGEV